MNLMINLDKAAPFLLMIGGAYAMWNGHTMESFGLFIMGSLWRIENLLEYGSSVWDELDALDEENTQ